MADEARAHDQIHVRAERLEQARDLRRIILTVAVDQDDHPFPRLGQAPPYGRALPAVHGQPEHARPRAGGHLPGGIRRAVVDDQHLTPRYRAQRLAYHIADHRRLVVCRHQHGDGR
jgi:hypothetical protein